MHNVNWWALLLRGIFAIIFGIIAFAWPGVTFLSIVFVFGFYTLMDGIFAIVAGARTPDRDGFLVVDAAFGHRRHYRRYIGVCLAWGNGICRSDVDGRVGTRDGDIRDHRGDTASQGH